MSDYRPINCSYYDELEAVAVLRREVPIAYLDNADRRVDVTTGIKDLYTRNGEEFAVLTNGTTLRLDRLVSVDGKVRAKNLSPKTQDGKTEDAGTVRAKTVRAKNLSPLPSPLPSPLTTPAPSPPSTLTIGPVTDDHFARLRADDYAGIAVLTDENTERHCLPLLREGLAAFDPVYISVPAGERHKTLDTCKHIWEQLFRAGAGRNWCLFNLGGGVIGDMGGFCAGTFKRGMDFVQIPTTLLSQVDASVGGKLGIDFYGIKNSIGLFQEPRAVWADARFLKTLPARELRSGFAEMLKHALIDDRDQWEELTRLDDLTNVDWADWVARSVAVKQRIVAEDPHERGLRKALNFGHTVGHAVESYFLETDTPLLHGEAIAIGMICEAWLSNRKAGLPAADLAAVTELIGRHYGFPALPGGIDDVLLATMRQDKKNEDARINFSLLPALGQVVVNQTATEAEIVESLAYYRAQSED